MSHSVTLQIPFQRASEAQIVKNVLEVDKEAKGEIKREIRICEQEDGLLEIYDSILGKMTFVLQELGRKQFLSPAIDLVDLILILSDDIELSRLTSAFDHCRTYTSANLKLLRTCFTSLFESLDLNNPMISLHSHSGEFCKHAHGTLKQVIDQAIAENFTTYGLTEHMPRSRNKDLYPEEIELAMTCQDTLSQYEAFYAKAREFQQDYAGSISLLVGMETEWIHKDTGRELLELLRRFPVDYVVGSVHHVNEIPIDFNEEMFTLALEKAASLRSPSGSEGESSIEYLFQDYFDSQYDMLSFIKPAVVGHFDLIRMWPLATAHPISHVVLSKIKRNISLIKSYNGLVEINSRGFKKACKCAYPMPDILDIMIKEGVRFTLSDDSHGWKDVGLFYKETIAYLREKSVLMYGLRLASSTLSNDEIDEDQAAILRLKDRVEHVEFPKPNTNDGQEEMHRRR